MAVSGVTTGLMTAGGAITYALKLIGVLDADSTPSASMMADGVTALNWMLKSMQADGMNVFRQTQEVLPVAAGTQTITLDPLVLDVVEARWSDYQSETDTVWGEFVWGEAAWGDVVVYQTFQRPLARYQYQDYQTLPIKTNEGPVTLYMFDKQVNATFINLFYVPARDGLLRFTAARVIDDVTSVDDNFDLPQEWTECVFYNLADRLTDQYGQSQEDNSTAERVRTRAAGLYEKMKDFDRPNVVSFRPWGRTTRRRGGY